MKIFSKKTVVALLLVVLLTGVSNAETTSIVKAKLDAVNKTSVVFNGRTYQYSLNKSKSVLAIDENAPEEIKLRDLKVGGVYYFELFSSREEAKANDFKQVIFISDKYQGGDE